MKSKDIIGLVFAFLLLGGVAYFAINSLGAKPKTVSKLAASQYEIVPSIDGELDPSGTLDKIDSVYKVRDFKLPISLTGLGNPAPFSL